MVRGAASFPLTDGHFPPIGDYFLRTLRFHLTGSFSTVNVFFSNSFRLCINHGCLPCSSNLFPKMDSKINICLVTLRSCRRTTELRFPSLSSSQINHSIAEPVFIIPPYPKNDELSRNGHQTNAHQRLSRGSSFAHKFALLLARDRSKNLMHTVRDRENHTNLCTLQNPCALNRCLDRLVGVLTPPRKQHVTRDGYKSTHPPRRNQCPSPRRFFCDPAMTE